MLFAPYLGLVSSKTRLSFPCINGPNVKFCSTAIVSDLLTSTAEWPYRDTVSGRTESLGRFHILFSRNSQKLCHTWKREE